ncbi:SDR family oxidoreductase [Actinocorallia aurantiaca]|uniref:SDR family oxidoreductase n=1 Tax=Actinocorallia aurantiaca TaxID=46204 RepID=A0ABN3UCJ0_9ACTN
MNLFRLDGKTALVTGGTRGIGLMIARGLLEAGAAKVIISSRKADAVDQAVAELSKTGGGEVVGVPADLSTEAECRRLAETVDGPLHILVNNAGATWGAPLEEFPSSAWDKVLDLNLKSPFYLTQALLPRLKEAATPDDPARIINIGSVDGIMTPGQRYSYTSSKAAIHQLTRVLAKELGPEAITVNAIAPGPFESKMMAATLDAFGDAVAQAVPLKRIGRPDDMAGTAVFLSSRAGSYVNGAVIPVDGGLTVI